MDNSFSLPGNDGYRDDDYQSPVDVRSFCSKLREAWLSVPDESFSNVLELIFNGYNLHEISSEEMVEMLDEFIMQNCDI